MVGLKKNKTVTYAQISLKMVKLGDAEEDEMWQLVRLSVHVRLWDTLYLSLLHNATKKQLNMLHEATKKQLKMLHEATKKQLNMLHEATKKQLNVTRSNQETVKYVTRSNQENN